MPAYATPDAIYTEAGEVRVSGDYAALPTDRLIVVDATSGPVTVTLPPSTGIPGHVNEVKKEDATANLVTVAFTGSETRDGAATAAIADQWGTLQQQARADGLGWYGVQVAPLGVTDHGALTGLGDDDHTQYLLAAGTRALGGDWSAGGYDIRNIGQLTAGSYPLSYGSEAAQMSTNYAGTTAFADSAQYLTAGWQTDGTDGNWAIHAFVNSNSTVVAGIGCQFTDHTSDYGEGTLWAKGSGGSLVEVLRWKDTGVGIGTDPLSTSWSLNTASYINVEDGTKGITLGAFGMSAFKSTGSSAGYIRLAGHAGWDGVQLYADGSEVARVDATGLGIGAIPGYDGVHVWRSNTALSGTTIPAVTVENASTGRAGYRLLADSQEWMLMHQNDSSANQFALWDVTAGTIPFIVQSGAPTYAINVAASGNVGIQENAPGAPFHATDATANEIARFESGDSGVDITLRDNSANCWLRWTGSSGEFLVSPGLTQALRVDASFTDIRADSVQRFRADATGVSVGPSNPSDLFHVSATANANAFRVDDGTGRVFVGGTGGGSALNVTGNIAGGAAATFIIDAANTQPLWLRGGGTLKNGRLELFGSEIRLLQETICTLASGVSPSDLWHVNATGSANAHRIDDATSYHGMGMAPDTLFRVSSADGGAGGGAFNAPDLGSNRWALRFWGGTNTGSGLLTDGANGARMGLRSGAVVQVDLRTGAVSYINTDHAFAVGDTASANAKVKIKSAAASAWACLDLVQDDDDEPFARFEGTEQAGVGKSISTWTTPGSIVKWVKVQVDNGTSTTDGWMPVYSNPSA